MLPSFKEKFLEIPANPSPAFPDRRSSFWPLIHVRLFSNIDETNYIDFKALVDSGANFNIFPGFLAEKIGLKVINDKIEKIAGIGGQLFDGYYHEIILGLGGWKFNSFALFTFADIICPVLGRDGFFDLFEIKIDYSKKEIEFKAKIKPL
jgi:hypothetical protein